MLLNRRVNLKKYLLLALLTTCFALAFCQGPKEWAGVAIVFVASIFNQLILVEIGCLLVFDKEQNGKVDTKKIVVLAFLKFLILILGIVASVHLMGSRVIIALINYVAMIFVLMVSLKS